MITITQQQIAVFNEDFLRRQQERLIAHLRRAHPEKADDLGEDAFRQQSMENFQDARALRIYEEENLARFMAIPLILTQEQLGDLVVQEVLVRVLNNIDWTEHQRLDFLYKHLLGLRGTGLGFGGDHALHGTSTSLPKGESVARGSCCPCAPVGPPRP